MAKRKGPQGDVDTIQSQICMAGQRVEEKNCITLWLMRPFMWGICLRIHAVIAICYVLSPVGETHLKTVEVEATNTNVADYHTVWFTFYVGSAIGCLLWLFLSRGVPPNFLMATSQLSNILFFFIVPSIPDDYLYERASLIAYV